MAVCRARWRARVRAELPHVARLGDAVSRVLLADDAMRTAVGAARAMTDAQKLLRAAGLTEALIGGDSALALRTDREAHVKARSGGRAAVRSVWARRVR